MAPAVQLDIQRKESVDGVYAALELGTLDASKVGVAGGPSPGLFVF